MDSPVSKAWKEYTDREYPGAVGIDGEPLNFEEFGWSNIISAFTSGFAAGVEASINAAKQSLENLK